MAQSKHEWKEGSKSWLGERHSKEQCTVPQQLGGFPGRPGLSAGCEAHACMEPSCTSARTP
jgi:hypothetical protein